MNWHPTDYSDEPLMGVLGGCQKMEMNQPVCSLQIQVDLDAGLLSVLEVVAQKKGTSIVGAMESLMEDKLRSLEKRMKLKK